MSNVFQAVGTFSMSKATDKFSPFLDMTSKNGKWKMPKLRFNLNDGDYTHNLQIEALYPADGNGNITFMTSATYENGQRVSDGEKVTISRAERNDPKYTEMCANWRKYIIDLNTPSERSTLSSVLSKKKDNEALTEDDYKALGVDNETDANKKIASLKANHMEFIDENDYLCAMKKCLEDGVFGNNKFRIVSANMKYSYNPVKGQTYETIMPTHIYRQNDDEPMFTTVTTDFYFANDAVDESMLEEKHKVYIHGWIRTYESSLKKDIFVSKVITMNCNPDDEMDKKRLAYIKNKFTNDSSEDLYSFRLNCMVIDGAPKVNITMDDLSDNTKDQILLGFKTFEQCVAELGGYKRGDSVHEWTFISPVGDGKVEKETGVTKANTAIVNAANQSSSESNDGFVKISTATDSADDDFNNLFGL